ncbi:MAG: hypothetical protein AABY88_06960, partial [Pseudomonadota bacterium]
ILITFLMFLTTGNVFAVDNQNNGVHKILGATDVKTAADINISVDVGSVNLYFFYSKTCPHCQAEALFLKIRRFRQGVSLSDIYLYPNWSVVAHDASDEGGCAGKRRGHHIPPS